MVRWMGDTKETGVKICARCVLPDNYPGIRFSEDGTCSHCARHAKEGSGHAETKERCHQKLLSLLSRLGETAARGGSSYDVLVGCSGGKDRSHTLKVLRKDFGLRVIALTL